MHESLPWWFVVPVAFAVGIFLLVEQRGRRWRALMEWIGVTR